MLPIRVMFDSGLKVNERLAIEEAVSVFGDIFPDREIHYVGAIGASGRLEGKHPGANWYIENAQPANDDQLEAKSLIDLMRQELQQSSSPHINVLFTSRDLTTWYLDFCFGLTDDRYTVQSVYRYRELDFRDDVSVAIKAALWHELGHLLGAVRDKNRSNTEDEVGVHCTNFGCIMRNSMSLSELLRNAKDAMRKKTIYCPQCMGEIQNARI